jgi:transposase
MDGNGLIEGVAASARTTGRKSGRSQPIEVITRGERRRRWSIEQKREIVAASLRPGARAGEVAREHGITTGLLYTWRRQMLEGQFGMAAVAMPRFARVEIAAPTDHAALPGMVPGGVPCGAEMTAPGSVASAVSHAAGRIEIVLPGGIAVRVDATVDSDALRRVLAALGGR